MIFANAPLIESEKERNLCAKFFAGYFFNEFIPGYSKRINLFNRYIQEVSKLKPSPKTSPACCIGRI